MADGSIGLWTVPLAVFGGAIRVSTPFLFVSLGDALAKTDEQKRRAHAQRAAQHGNRHHPPAERGLGHARASGRKMRKRP